MITISSPTSLATFQTSQASSSKLQHVRAAAVAGTEQNLTALSIQGDGVWTYDLSTSRPVNSYAVPPGTIFTTAPLCFTPDRNAITRKGKGKEKETRLDDGLDVMEVDSSVEGDDERIPNHSITIIGVSSSASKKHKDGEIWIWKDEQGEEKQVINVKGQVQAIHRTTSSQFPVICVLSSGDIVVLDSSFNITLTHESDSGKSEVLTSSVKRVDEKSSLVIFVLEDGRVDLKRISFSDEARIESVRAVEHLSLNLEACEVSADGVVIAIDDKSQLHIRDTINPATAQSLHKLLSPTTALCTLPGTRPIAALVVNKPIPTLLIVNLEPLAVLATLDISSLINQDSHASSISIISQISPFAITLGVVVWHKTAESGRSVVHTFDVALPEKGIGMKDLIGSSAKTSLYFDIPRNEEEPIRGKKNKHNPSERILTILDNPNLSNANYDEVTTILKTNTIINSESMAKILKRSLKDKKHAIIYPLILNLGTPATDYRMWLRRLLNAQDSVRLLESLVKWSKEWSERRHEGLEWQLDSDSTQTAPDEKGGMIPTLESVIIHSNILLDTHLPLFLDSPTSFPLLQELNTCLGPLMMFQNQINQIRAPINALLTLSKREEKRRADARTKRESMKPVTDGEGLKGRKGKAIAISRKNRGAKGEGRDDVGVLPGEEVGKWRVEDFVF